MANKGNAHLDATSGKVPALESAGAAVLAEVTGIDLKATGPTTLYTVPAGKTLYLTDVLLVITAVDTFATPATVRVGKAAAYIEWLAASALTGLDAIGEFVSLSTFVAATGLLRQTFAAGEVVALDVTVGAGATTLTATAYPIGILI